MKVAFFGASVTEQKKSYAVKSKNFFKNKYKAEVEIFGFGGMHIFNAGICFVSDVLRSKPTHCFLDWFSTSYSTIGVITEQYILSIAYKLLMNDCQPIFLIFPHHYGEKKTNFIEYCIEIMNRNKIPFINVISEIKQLDLCGENILRDHVHTTYLGSSIYSDIIQNKFKKNILNFNSTPCFFDEKYLSFIDIKKISVDAVVQKSIKLIGCAQIIGFHLIAGPHSCQISFNERLFNTRNKWCYYYRDCFNISVSINNKAIVTVCDNNLNQSSFICNIKKNALWIKSIYYIGDSLSIDINPNHQKINYKFMKCYNLFTKVVYIIKNKYLKVIKLKE